MIFEWVDVRSLRHISLAVAVVAVVAAVLVLRFVRRMAVRVVVFVMLAAVAVVLLQQRVGLDDCVQTCSCRMFAQSVTIPAGVNPNCS